MHGWGESGTVVRLDAVELCIRSGSGKKHSYKFSTEAKMCLAIDV